MSTPLSIVLRTLLVRYGWVVVVGGLVGGVGGAGFALTTPKLWEAGQQLAVRDELIGNAIRPGRFDSADQLRAAQETVRSVARSREVVAAVLSRFDPPTNFTGSTWPDDESVDDFREQIGVSAANGAEFGQTEVLVITVKERSPERAQRVTEALVEELSRQLSQVRDARLASMEEELQRNVTVARDSVASASTELVAVERRIGVDLSELRSMNDPSGSEGPLRRQMGQTRQDIVTAQQRRSELQAQQAYLEQLIADPLRIVSTPESLLSLHPELRRLKEAIVDSVVNDSRLRSKYEANHPQVLAAAGAHQALTTELRLQLDSALSGTKLELQLIGARLTELQNVETDLSSRLVRLAEERVPYSEVVHRVEQRKVYLSTAENSLTEVQAARDAAEHSAVVAPIGTARAGVHPVGPGRVLIAAAGAGGGMMLAIGLIALWFDPASISASAAARPLAANTTPMSNAPVSTNSMASSVNATTQQTKPASNRAPVSSPATVTPATVTPAATSPATAAPSTAVPKVSSAAPLLGSILTHSSLTEISPVLPVQTLSGQDDPERQRWQAIENLSGEIAELRDSIATRRREALDQELAKYPTPQASPALR